MKLIPTGLSFYHEIFQMNHHEYDIYAIEYSNLYIIVKYIYLHLYELLFDGM